MSQGTPVADWMTVRVVLRGRETARLPLPPGRVLLAAADHTFAELAEAVDVAFGRWDLTPPHEFVVEGRRLLSDLQVAGPDDREVEESGGVTLGGVGLRPAAPFRYVFDLGERWVHECDVETAGVDPFDAYGEEPDLPVPVFGWGTVPDQYDRERESDGSDDEGERAEQAAGDRFQEPAVPGAGLPDWDDQDDEELLASWDEAHAAAWAVVERAVAEVDRRRDDANLTRVTAGLRRAVGGRGLGSAEALLWAAADLPEPPEDDAELWLALAAAVVEPRGDLPVDLEAEAAWASLEPADWAGVVIELVRAGIGAPGTPDDLVELVARCPEVEGPDLTAEDEDLLVTAFTPVVELWQALGALDGAARLTALGRWGLPLALRRAWIDD